MNLFLEKIRRLQRLIPTEQEHVNLNPAMLDYLRKRNQYINPAISIALAKKAI